MRSTTTLFASVVSAPTIFVILLAGLVACPASGQDEDGRPAETEPSAEAYRADIQELAETIRTTHPRPFQVQSEQAFDALLAGELASVDAGWTRRDLLWSMSRIIASIGCGHSQTAAYFTQQDALIAPADRFPVDVRLVAGRLLVIDPLTNGARLSVGEEIVSINGRPVTEIMEGVFRHIAADSNLRAPKQDRFNVYATSYLTYELGFPGTYSVRTTRSDGVVPLTLTESFAHRPIISPDDPCPDTLCFRIDPATGVPVMRIRSFGFYGNDGAAFAEFVDDSFAAIVASGAEAILIDVRNNHGGSGLAAAYLLRRLATKPFRYWANETDPRAIDDLFEIQHPVDTGYDGEVFVLINADTFSSVPHFAALARHNGMATLFGEPAGGGVSTNDGKRLHTSSSFGVEYLIARMRFDVDASTAGIDGPVQPDVLIERTTRDVLFGEDSQLFAAIQLAHGATATEPG